MGSVVKFKLDNIGLVCPECGESYCFAILLNPKSNLAKTGEGVLCLDDIVGLECYCGFKLEFREN